MIKIKKRKFLLLPGDGIGPEVVGEVKKIILWFNNNKSLDFEIEEDLAGGVSYDKHGTPITDEEFYKALFTKPYCRFCFSNAYNSIWICCIKRNTNTNDT